MGTYKDSDFVHVVDDNGVVQPHKIPKQWIDTDLAPGVKKATAKQVDKSDVDEDDSPETTTVTGQ